MTAPLLLHVFPSFAVGGAQVRFAALANRFGARWRHAVVALDGDTACATRLVDAVSFLPPPFAAGAGTVRRLVDIVGMLRGLRPALLVTSNWGSMDWAVANLVARRPHLHTEDGFGPEERSQQLSRRVWARRLALRGSRVVLPSATLEAVALRQWRLPARNLHRIANGIDLRRFSPLGEVAALDVPGEGPLIGTAAALRPEKNIGRLVRAVAALRDAGMPARLAIVGDGPERGRLEALVSQLSLAGCTRFLGQVDDPAAAYRAFDIFTLSSDTEQMPFSILEAMASGLAVAATDVGDVAKMLPPENRPYVVPCDDAALAAALGGLLGDPALRARIGAANLACARRDFDQEVMFQAHAKLIDQSIGA